METTVKLYNKILKLIKKHKGKLNSELAKTKFIWIDDGKNGLNEIQLKDSTTGEIKNIKLK